MRRPRDSQRSKLYAAEQDAWLGKWSDQALFLHSPAIRRAWVQRWEATAGHYRQHDSNWPDGEAAFFQAVGTREDVDAFIERVQRSRWWKARGYRRVVRVEGYQGRTTSRGGSGRIRLIRHHWNRWTVLHEMAHAVLPDGVPWHGPHFARIYLDLVTRFIGKEEGDALRAAYVKHRVRHRVTPGRQAGA